MESLKTKYNREAKECGSAVLMTRELKRSIPDSWEIDKYYPESNTIHVKYVLPFSSQKWYVMSMNKKTNQFLGYFKDSELGDYSIGWFSLYTLIKKRGMFDVKVKRQEYFIKQTVEELKCIL